MNKVLSLLNPKRQQGLFLMAFRGATLVAKFVLTLFIARFLGLEALGLYGLIVAAVFVLPAITSLGIMHSKIRDAVTQSESEIVRTLHYYTRYMLGLYFCLILMSAAFGFYAEHLILALLVIFVFFFEHFTNDLYFLLLNLSRPFAANITHFIRTALWIVAYMATAYIYPEFRNITSLLVFWLVGEILCVLSMFFIFKNWSWKLEKPLGPMSNWIRKEFKRGKILYWRNIVTTTATYADRGVISLFLGLELTGIYVFYWSIASALANLIQTGILQSFRPKFVRIYKEAKGNILSLYKKCMAQTTIVAAVLSTIMLGFIYLLLPYINKPEMLQWYPILPVILFGLIFKMACATQDLILYARKEDMLALKLNIVVYSISLTATAVFIILFGLWGAIMGYVFMNVLSYIVQHKYIKNFMAIDVFDSPQKNTLNA